MKQVSVKFQEFWSDPPSAQLHTTFIFYTSVYSETSVCTQTASSSTFILTFFKTSVLVFLLGVLYLREYSSHLRLQEGHTVLFQPAHQPSVGSWEQGFLLHIKLFWFFFFHFWKKKDILEPTEQINWFLRTHSYFGLEDYHYKNDFHRPEGWAAWLCLKRSLSTH